MTEQFDPIREPQSIVIEPDASDLRFDGIGAVNGGGATSVLLKDYPEPQRSQILDLVFRPKFGASVSALLAEVPGDGNSTQGSMPSHSHTRDDLHTSRGYTWWILQQARARNARLSLDAVAWSAPGWIGNGEFWSQDMADYYVTWLRILRDEYGLELDAIGCRNEKGVSLPFARTLRDTLDGSGFSNVRLHAFDNWPADKFDFVRDLADHPDARDAIDIIGAHVMYDKPDGHIPADVLALARQMGKPIWNTEDHVYKDGFDCLISIVECFNENYLHSAATKTILWYDVAGVYPMQPYSVQPAMILAHSPWSGHYEIREALWGYAHYGQFTELGWAYVDSACAVLDGGGTAVTLASGHGEYSVIVETKDASAPQRLQFAVGGDLTSASALCVWRSTQDEQFVRLDDIVPVGGRFELWAEPDAVYSISTTTGQQKGCFPDVPDDVPFPMPYREDFSSYSEPERHGMLPRYTADIAGAFEIVDRPEGGRCLQQVVPVPTLSWAPDWRPYTIAGDESWQDVEVSVRVSVEPAESAALMARVNHVGTGYGIEPKGYYLEVTGDGEWRLVSSNGKLDKSELVGDAEQQAIIRAQGDAGRGGERVLAEGRLSPSAGLWRVLRLRCEGSIVEAAIDGEVVCAVSDSTHAHGMVGLLAGAIGERLSRPLFDDLRIGDGAHVASESTGPHPSWRPIYGGSTR
ncbi:hypothetical protein [Microbacterium sp. Marseille-Q6648]|uniref:hypothetical protein n=1 Tax=Microbacterium sp. Marseille-Q6648 TaxID=2937991 RepID=UPI002042139A|nr:hypothetical protein [Microbacterium sp. Marseille-Q6648]